MSSRQYLIAVSALLLASLCGAATPVNAGDTSRWSPKAANRASAINRSVGHPGKSALFPQRDSVQCSRPVRKRSDARDLRVRPGRQRRWCQAGPNVPSNRSMRTAPSRLGADADQSVRGAHGAAPVRRGPRDLRCGRRERQREALRCATAPASRARCWTRVRPWPTRTARCCTCCRVTPLAAQSDLASARAIAPRAFFVMRNSDAAVPTRVAGAGSRTRTTCRSGEPSAGAKHPRAGIGGPVNCTGPPASFALR